MNVMVEQCSSGCESGWTLYLDHSNYNNNATLDNKNRRSRGKIACGEYHSNGFCSVDDEEEEEEEEDLSMVSDASSGPPHFDHDVFDEDDDEVFCYGSNGGRKLTQSVKLTRCRFEVEDIELDDTASSPMFFSSKKKGGVVHDNVQNQGSSLESLIDYSSQGFSATHFQERSANFQERYGFLQSPYPTEQLQQNQW